MSLALLILALATKAVPSPAPIQTPIPYHNAPCATIIADAHIAGEPESLDLFGRVFVTILDEKLRSHPNRGLAPTDIYQSESDFNACVIPAPPAATPPPAKGSPKGSARRHS